MTAAERRAVGRRTRCHRAGIGNAAALATEVKPGAATRVGAVDDFGIVAQKTDRCSGFVDNEYNRRLESSLRFGLSLSETAPGSSRLAITLSCPLEVDLSAGTPAVSGARCFLLPSN